MATLLDWIYEEAKAAFTALEELRSSQDLLNKLGYNQSQSGLFDRVLVKLHELDRAQNKLAALWEVVSTLNDIPKTHTSLNELPKRLINYLLLNHLKENSPGLYSFLQLVGLAQITFIEETETTPSFFLHEIKWEKMTWLLSDPKGLFTDRYGWGTELFDSNALVENIKSLIWGLGIQTRLPTEEEFSLPVNARLKFHVPLLSQHYLIRDGSEDFDTFQLGVALKSTTDPQDRTNEGIALVPYASGRMGLTLELGSNWKLEIKGDLELDGGITLSITPKEGGEVVLSSSIEGSITTNISTSSPESICLLEFGKSKIQVDEVSFCGEIKSGEFLTELVVKQLTFILAGGDGDGFVQKLLPQDPIALHLDLSMGIGSEKGFYIKGGAGLSYTFHLNKTLGPVFITTVDLELDVKDSEVTLLATASGGADIGPIHASLQKVGLKAAVDFGETDALSIDFKPPSGVGLTLDTQGLKGGGFLAIDPPIYFGIVNASFQDTFDLTIIGLIATQLPGGQPGFSMILSVLAEFQPIQLGFGFALNGVGGLIAIHRSMNEAALRETFNSHSLDLILFPRNPIRDITRILTAISSVFPAQQDHHTLGLMALISWGGSLVKGRLGILIELGGPGRIALMGQITAALPDESNQLVVLNMEILGFVDFGKQTLAIDATLYNSRVLIFAISGDMALRLNYSDTQADFALAVGGFFPGYSPTIEFPSLKRAMVGLDNDFATICFESYFAITSNSVQTGARLKLAAQWASIEIAGASGFDALIRFNPFSFETLFYIWVKVKFEGVSITSIDIRVHLTGPNPFHAYGYAEIGLFFFSVKVDFDATFGERNEEISTEISPFALLVLEAQDVKNVSFDIPNWAETGVVLKKTAEEKKILDPLGAIIFSQKTVPLKLELERFANVIPPENERYLDLTFASGAENEVRGKFAPAQFHDWSDQEKLAAPPFESFVNGKRLESSFVIGASPVEKEIRFETIVWEKERRIENAQSIKLDPFVKQALYAPSKLKSNPKHKKYVSVSTPLYTVTSAQSIDGKFKRESHLDMTYTEAKTWAAKWGSKDGVIRTKGFVAEDLQIPLGRR